MSVWLRRVILHERLSTELEMGRPYRGATSHSRSHDKKCGLRLKYRLLVLLRPLVLSQIVQRAAAPVLELGVEMVLKFHEALITFSRYFLIKTSLPLTQKK